MRTLFLTALAGPAAFASVAAAQPGGHDERDAATICLDTLGVTHPANCHTLTASRLESKPDICLCQGPWLTVKAPWCAADERPAPDTAAFDRERYAYAGKHGNSLFGFSYNGQRACQPVPKNGR